MGGLPPAGGAGLGPWTCPEDFWPATDGGVENFGGVFMDGEMGTVFGRHHVNIADMSVGRGAGEAGGAAVGVVALDTPPPAEALAEVLALDVLEHAWVVKLPPAGKMPDWMGG